MRKFDIDLQIINKYFYANYQKPNCEGDYVNNPFSEYIISWRKKSLVPMAHWFDSKRLLKNEIKMDNLMMGDVYAEALSNTIPFRQAKASINMQNNRLSQNGANTILRKLSK